MRVLMLGWEFPPFISGGLGTACHGLTRAMNRLAVDVLFVLPASTGVEGGTLGLLSDVSACKPSGAEAKRTAFERVSASLPSPYVTAATSGAAATRSPAWSHVPGGSVIGSGRAGDGCV